MNRKRLAVGFNSSHHTDLFAFVCPRVVADGERVSSLRFSPSRHVGMGAVVVPSARAFRARGQARRTRARCRRARATRVRARGRGGPARLRRARSEPCAASGVARRPSQRRAVARARGGRARGASGRRGARADAARAAEAPELEDPEDVRRGVQGARRALETRGRPGRRRAPRCARERTGVGARGGPPTAFPPAAETTARARARAPTTRPGTPVRASVRARASTRASRAPPRCSNGRRRRRVATFRPQGRGEKSPLSVGPLTTKLTFSPLFSPPDNTSPSFTSSSSRGELRAHHRLNRRPCARASPSTCSACTA